MNDLNKQYPFATIGSGVGFTIGLVYAFKTESGFWKGFGYTILGSMALGGIGRGVDYLVDKDGTKKGVSYSTTDLTADVYEGDVNFR